MSWCRERFEGPLCKSLSVAHGAIVPFVPPGPGNQRALKSPQRIVTLLGLDWCLEDKRLMLVCIQSKGVPWYFSVEWRKDWSLLWSELEGEVG